MEKPSIPEFFTGKSVFITGGTGFMGKVLIEKMLRSCPGVEQIYVLMRPKRGKSLEERIKLITELPLFDLLKETNASQLKKIVPLNGDVTKLKLGLSPEDEQLLIENTNIIVHAAASVRFDDPLKDAILMNTRGTREVVNLAKQMKDLYCLVHLSTTYCNTDRKVIAEEIYPAHADWRDSIELAENYDSHVLDVLTTKYLNKLPNTYTFTKSMGEHVINDLCVGEIPAVILRPSIVISTMKDPIPGWIDNFNGPVGLLVASGKGVMRSVYTNRDVVADYVPVDIVIKAILLAAWDKGLQQGADRLALDVYNCSNKDVRPVVTEELLQMGLVLLRERPLDQMLWYPNQDPITKCYYYHYLRVIFYQILPALFVDLLLRIFGKKPILLKVQRKIFIANIALEYFITQGWTFCNENILKLELKTLARDAEDFGFDRHSPCSIPYIYFKNATIGCKTYLLKEHGTLESARSNATRMWIMSKIFNFAWYAAVFWLAFYKFQIQDVVKEAVVRYIENGM